MNRLLGVVLAVVVAATVLWWTSNGTVAPPGPIGGGASPPQIGAQSGETRTAEVASGAATDRLDPVSRSRVESDASPVADPAVPDSETAVVLVVEAGSDRAVAHARIWLCDRETFQAARTAAPKGTVGDADPMPVLRRAGEAHVVDADGMLRIARAKLTPGAVIGAAESGDVGDETGLVGWRVLDRSAGTDAAPIVVEIEPVTQLTLRVVDGRGLPCADVPLSCGLRRDRGMQRIWSGKTGPDGVVVMTQLRQRVRTVALQTKSPVKLATVFVDALFSPSPALDLDPAIVPSEPLEIRLPDHGSVRVELERNGASPVSSANASLSLRGADDSRDFCVHGASIEMKDGQALSPLVGLDLHLRAAVQVAGASSDTDTEFDGPRAPAQEVRVVVSLVADERVVLARLIDEVREPFRSVSLALRVSAAEEHSSTESSSSLRTDPEGRVRIHCTDEFGPDAERSIAFRDDTRSLEAFVSLPKPLPKGETDLGDVTLTGSPLLASGRVVGPDDAPIANASIDVIEIEDTSVRTDKDGRFEVRARSDAKSLRLTVSVAGFLRMTTQPLLTGTREVVIRLDRAAIIAGEILLDATLTQVDLRVELRPTVGGKATSQTARGGPFEFGEVAPGAYSVTVSLAGRKEPVARRDGVVAESGARVDLSAFDLRGRLRSLAFELTDENGVPIEDANALLVDDVSGDGSPRFEGVMVKDGHGRIVTDDRAVDVFVFADDHCGVLVRALRDGERIVLPSQPKVVVHAGAVPDGFALHVELNRTDDPWPTSGRFTFRGSNGTRSMSGARPWDRDSSAALDASGRMEIPVPSAGTYRITCSLRARGGADARRSTIEGTTPGEIVVPTGRSVVDVELTWGQSAVDDATKRLR